MDGSRVALVTGATGFVGSHLVRRLLSEEFEVRALTSGTRPDRLTDAPDRVRWFPLSDDGIAEATRGATHFFGFAVVYDRPAFSDAQIRLINVETPLKIIAALLRQNGDVPCVLGDSFYRKFPVEATTQRRYTTSKLDLARQVQTFAPHMACRIAMMLIEQVYGPGEHLDKAYPRVIRQLLQHTRVPLTPGNQRRDFIHVDDVVEAALVASRGDWSGVATVECGVGEAIAVRAVFERLKELSESHSALGFGDLAHDHSIPCSVADTTWLAQRGWRPIMPLDAGLASLIADVRRRSAGLNS